MQGWVRSSFRLFAGAFALHACAGKSISRTDADVTSSDDGVGGGIPGAGGSVMTGGRSGTDGRGGTAGVGKGGGGGTIAPTGGKAGFGGTSGTNVGGEDSGGFGGDGNDCLPSRADSHEDVCSLASRCISVNSPTNEHIARNEPAPEGDSGTDPVYVTEARLCDAPDRDGFLAVDYFVPRGADSVQGLMLLDNPGTFSCGGSLIGMANFSDFSCPPDDAWTTQCLAVSPSDFSNFMVAISARSNFHRLRNLRFVSSCECPRRMKRYTTCGDITSPLVCQ